MTDWPGPIGAITLFVEDLASTREFYGRAFDLSPVFETDDSIVFRFDGLHLNLLAATSGPELVEPAAVAPRSAGTGVVFSLEVDDVDASCAALAARGVTLLNGPMDRPWGIRTASFSDPDGHVWEIAH